MCLTRWGTDSLIRVRDRKFLLSLGGKIKLWALGRRDRPCRWLSTRFVSFCFFDGWLLLAFFEFFVVYGGYCFVFFFLRQLGRLYVAVLLLRRFVNKLVRLAFEALETLYCSWEHKSRRTALRQSKTRGIHMKINNSWPKLRLRVTIAVSVIVISSALCFVLL